MYVFAGGESVCGAESRFCRQKGRKTEGGTEAAYTDIHCSI
jgi:hypothetical protein